MKLKHLTFALMALPMAALATSTNGEEAQTTIQFSSEVTKQISPDLLQVRVYIQEEGKDLKALNSSISNKANQALKLIKAQPAVEIQSNNRQTYPRDNGKSMSPKVWVETAEFVLQSKDFPALSQLVNELSELVAIDNINAVVSDETLQQLEDEMIQQVLAQFNHKATLIQKSLNAKGYEIVELMMNTPAEQERYPRVYMAKSAVSSFDSEPTQLESGKTTVRARVDGQIQLVK